MTADLDFIVAAEAAPGDPADPGLPATMADRLLMFVRAPRFRALVSTFAARTASLVTLAASIRDAFDLTTGVGVQLDRLGEILQLPRPPGVGDVRYRVLLQIQIQLILASQGTTATLLEIVRLYTGAEAPEYYETHPALVGIGAVIDPGETPQLLELLGKAKVGGVRLTLIEQAADTLVLDYASDPVGDPGILDYADNPIAGADTLAYALVI